MEAIRREQVPAPILPAPNPRNPVLRFNSFSGEYEFDEGEYVFQSKNSETKLRLDDEDLGVLGVELLVFLDLLHDVAAHGFEDLVRLLLVLQGSE